MQSIDALGRNVTGYSKEMKITIRWTGILSWVIGKRSFIYAYQEIQKKVGFSLQSCLYKEQRAAMSCPLPCWGGPPNGLLWDVPPVPQPANPGEAWLLACSRCRPPILCGWPVSYYVRKPGTPQLPSCHPDRPHVQKGPDLWLALLLPLKALNKSVKYLLFSFIIP